ncbi:MAG: Signal transduction response regulator [Promethearchaeota archaeon]|nr:MAG: Signal transduction response regulator [Candidatus Lokiarchaeota archaeon]
MPSIFIVEDDRSIALLYQKFLKLHGFEVIDTATNGAEAVEKFAKFEKKPDLILMDHRMPIKNGMEASKEIIEMDESCHIIFASADKTIKHKALSLGITGFLEKPFSLEKLIEFLNKLFAKTHC